MDNPVRFSLNITQEESETVSRLSSKHGKTRTTVIRDGICLADWLDKVIARDASVIVKESDGTSCEVKFVW